MQSEVENHFGSGVRTVARSQLGSSDCRTYLGMSTLGIGSGTCSIVAEQRRRQQQRFAAVVVVMFAEECWRSIAEVETGKRLVQM